MNKSIIPENLHSLHEHEEACRVHALEIVRQTADMKLHLQATEAAMEIADQLRQVANDDEDFKVIRALSMRIFNAFGSATALALRGYGQNATMILRDVLETVFLLDYFKSNNTELTRWRTCDDKERRRDFQPSAIRKALDKRDGFTMKKRDADYRLFSEIAAHASMQSTAMLRPQPNADAVSGPFIEATGLAAVLTESGKLAVQAGGTLSMFFPKDHETSLESRRNFYALQRRWLERFFGQEQVRRVEEALKRRTVSPQF